MTFSNGSMASGTGVGWNSGPLIGTTAPNLSNHEIASNAAKQRGIAARGLFCRGNPADPSDTAVLEQGQE
jgi:hypothetical protein